ncbi:MFS transporter [Weissella soli]|uniref:Putative MFS transporter n=1 Tax=Weissella soli TaxID=155866 RepID=A0A288Q9U2_9LACO|nr:MFS transporter [Weissella soli]AOT55812.1 Synaptic vesicle 2-related protein [Weissella soli]NKY83625.1 MFS transporter [Weissella soli]RDL06514.1 putative MFS transporter [Weissella soli]GEN93433.1 MFS transporter [Weissella soli]
MSRTNKLLTVTGLAWLFDAMDVGLLSFLLVAVKQEWGLSQVQVGWIGSVNSIGLALGALTFGALADQKGRKPILIFTLLIFSIASGLSAFATGYAIFLVLRFFIGLGLGGELPVASTLVAENVPANTRARTIVLLESFWAVGWLVASLLSYFVIPNFGWRITLLITAMAAFYGLVIRRHVPANTIAEANIVKKPSIGERYRLIFSRLYRRQTTMLWIVWFMVMFSYYGIFLWLPSVLVEKGFSMVNSFGYVVIMTLAQLPGYFTAAWLIEKWGRKAVLTTFLFGTALSSVAFGFASNITLILIAGMLLSFFNLGAWGALYAYTPELYPTQVRATANGAAEAFGRLGGILGPLLLGIFLAHGYSFELIFGIFGLAVIIAIIAILTLGHETIGTDID